MMNFNKKRYKILALSDDCRSLSGVGTQAGILYSGLINTGKYSFINLGGAIKHASYEVTRPRPDLIVKPVDGFGTKEQLRLLLLTERPDALFLFTDPRQFIWVWEMEDEIRQICPIVYWHVWDNDPYPAYNKIWYDATDLINCLAYKTYELVKPNYPDKTHYIPHAFPKQMYGEIPKEKIEAESANSFGPRADWFKVLWVNRNAHRKMPGDVVASFAMFLQNLQKKHGHKKALLVMHTDPHDIEGPNLPEMVNLLGIKENVMFSNEKLHPEGMNTMHNLFDTTINISKQEGFGLTPLLFLQTGKPIIVLCTGGLTRQGIDYRDGTENGAAIKPLVRQLVGSQPTPYIYEDFASHEQVADAYMKIFEMTPEDKVKMKAKVLEYVDHEFNYENMIKRWDETLEKTILEFKEKSKKKWTIEQLENHNIRPITQDAKNQQVYAQNNIQIPEEIKKLPMDLTGYLLKGIRITKVEARA